MSELRKKKCKSCEDEGVQAFDTDTIHVYMLEIPSWELLDGGIKIQRVFEYQDFLHAMSFVNAVADIAELEGHHPDIHIHYNKVTIDLWTHNVGGLTENDFIVATKIDEFYNSPIIKHP
ncbi:MAG: 4a-hydroxytetrahydrobiopterin dehydratase [Planctomycetota bacterium]|jgi:4a-hydroxytetrahydrobiopterin dehydratase